MKTINNQSATAGTFKEWCEENQGLTEAVCLAQAAYEVTRERVDAYIRPIFDSFSFTYCGPLAESVDERAGESLAGKLLPSPAELYLCEDPRVEEYFDACGREHRRQGYDLPHGHCPALVAEHILIDAQNTLMESANPLFGLTRSPVLEDREQYLNLLIGACLVESNATAESILGDVR